MIAGPGREKFSDRSPALVESAAEVDGELSEAAGISEEEAAVADFVAVVAEIDCEGSDEDAEDWARGCDGLQERVGHGSLKDNLL